MVTIKVRTINKNRYYYLEHSVRKAKKVEKFEKYLGKMIPKNIERIKRDFLYEIYKKRWFGLFNKIKSNFAEEQKTLPKSAKEKELEQFSIRFTYDTQRIEGSKLTLRETYDLLENGITPNNRRIQDIKEAEAHQKVFYEMLEYSRNLNLQIILYWHMKLFEATKPDIAGKIRTHQVIISRSKFVPPSPVEIYPLIKAFFKWYNKSKGRSNPVELAALVHLKFVTIHPFGDGNGRISRLMMNFILNKYHFPVFNIKYEKRSGYYNALERTQIKKQDSIFLQWFFKRYYKEYKRYN